MLLAIDTTNPKKTSVLLAKKEKSFEVVKKKIWGAGENQSEELLPAIDVMLKKHKIEFKDVKLIIVSKGPGSFTGTRVGISVANALSFSLKIPVVGVKTENIDIEKIAKKGLEIYQKEKPKDLVIPYYSKKPNITI